MKVKKSELVIALECVRPAISNNEIIVGSRNFIFDTSNVTAYNDSICISYPFSTDETFAVSADDFLKTVKSVKEKEFELEVSKGVLTVNSKSTKASLAVLAAEDQQVYEMISALDLENADFKPLPENFIEALTMSRFSCAKDITSDNAHCVKVSGKHVFATDLYRVSRHELAGDTEDEFLLPAKAITGLKKHTMAHYCLQEGWVHFMSDDGTVFSSRTVAGEFPEIEDIFEEYEDAKGFIVFPSPDEVKEVVQSISFMSEEEAEEEKTVNVKVKPLKKTNVKVTCRAEKDIGFIERTVEAETRKPMKKEMAFLINPFFFADILGKTAKIKVDEDKAVFKMKNFLHIVSLMSLEEE